MENLKIYWTKLMDSLNTLSVPNLLLASVIGSFVGVFFKALHLNNIVIVLLVIAVAFDIVYSVFMKKNYSLIFSKAAAYSLLFIVGGGMAFYFESNAMFAAIGGIAYYAFGDIYRSIQGFINDQK